MTENEKATICRLRWRELGCAEIAEALGLPEGTVKTYCARNALRDSDLEALFEARREFAVGVVCICCGAALDQSPGHRHKRFCSDACRLAWWNAHRDVVNRKNAHVFICAACGREFSSYDPNRKFCSTPCYMNYRFPSVIKSKDEDQ